MTYTNTNERNILTLVAIACVLAISSFAFVGIARADDFNYSEPYTSNYSEPYTSNYSQPYANYSESYTQNYSEPYTNYSEPYAQNYSEPYTSNYSEPYSTAYYDTYTSFPSYYDTYSPTGYSSGYDYGYSLSYSYGSYGYSYPSYSSYVSPSYAYATPSYVQPSYSTSITTVSNPTTITDSGNTNTYAPYYSTYISTVSNPTTITDSGNSAYTSTYTSTTNIDSHDVTNIDSHNVTNVSSVSQATPQYTAQAYMPSYPTYYPYYGSSYSYPYTYSATPSCTITASAGANGRVVLTWYSANATSAYISPAVGSVSPSGSTNIYPYGNSLYTLTVSGAGGSADCQTSAYYNAVATSVSVSSTAPYVALTQIPYTGFDYGPVGNALYWLGILGFAVAAAYLVVYFIPALFRLRLVSAPVRAMNQNSAPTVHAEQKDKVSAPVASYFGTRDAMVAVHSKDGSAPRLVIT